MDDNFRKYFIFLCCISIAMLFVGCGNGKPRSTAKEEPLDMDLGMQVKDVADLIYLDSIAVEGYALVGGLGNRGTRQCPPQIRPYLEKYIKQQLKNIDNVDMFIESTDTAVVYVRGWMPMGAASGDSSFDLRVVALEGTDTQSLQGGWLWGADLYEAGRWGVSLKPVATAEGPVYVDELEETGSRREGFVLGGGIATQDYSISLSMHEPDYRMSNYMQNRLSARFGTKTAKAFSDELVVLYVPRKYARQRRRYAQLVRSTFLVNTHDANKERIRRFISDLQSGNNPQRAELTLEAVGKQSLGGLKQLLDSNNEEIRLRAARCMINMSDDTGFQVLSQIAMDNTSPLQLEALKAITAGARRNDASAVARRLIRSSRGDLMLAAYKSLKELDDPLVTTNIISKSITVDRIAQVSEPTIYATRNGSQTLALLGAPLKIQGDVFVQSSDGDITINAPANEPYVTVISAGIRRKPGHIKTLRNVYDLVQILGGANSNETEATAAMGVSFAEILPILRDLCEKGAVNAVFRVSELPTNL